MKKKWFALLALLAVFTSLTACKAGEEREKPASSPYKNGTYNVEWSAADHNGWSDILAVQMDNGILTVLEFDAEDKDGASLDSSTETTEAMAAVNAAAHLPVITPKAAHQAAVDSLVAAKGDPDQMELVAGATESCLSLKAMVKELLATKAQTGEKGICTVEAYLDGSYTVSQPAYDADGWKLHLTVSVSGGRVTIDQFDAANLENTLRSTVEGDKFGDQAAALVESYRTTEDLSKVTCEDEALTATFQQLLARALQNARFRGPQDDVLPTLKNGEYRAEMVQEDNGWKDYLVLVVSGDRVTVKEFDGKNSAGDTKRSHADWQKEEGGWDVKTHFDAIIAAFKAANYKVVDMENVAGATVSTNNFKLMVGELLGYSAVTGDTTALQVGPVGSEQTVPTSSTSSSEDSSSSSK